LESIGRHEGSQKDETILHGQLKVEISTDAQGCLAEEFILVDHETINSSFI